MKLEEHYDLESAENITLAGAKPLMNTYAVDKTLFNPKYFQCKYPIDSFQGDCMNIAFYQGQQPDIYPGELIEWKFYDESSIVKVVDTFTLFVKGLHIVYFIVQILI